MQAAQNLSTADDPAVDPCHPDYAAWMINEFGTAAALRIAARVLMDAADRGPNNECLCFAMVLVANICTYVIKGNTPEVIH